MNTALKGQDLDFLWPFSNKRTLVDTTKTYEKIDKPSIKLENNEIENKNPFDDSFAIDSSVLVEYPLSSCFSSTFSNSNSSSSSKSKSVKEKVTYDQLLRPFTSPWILQRIRSDESPQALTTLRSWVHQKRRPEVDDNLIRTLSELDEETALQALESLLRPRKYIRGGKGQQLDLPVLLESLTGNLQIRAKALIDSGCTGSCIDKDFVKLHGLSTYQTPIPIPVYNADGTRNNTGSITELVKV